MSRSKMIIFTAVSAVLVLSFACSGPVLDQESPATQVPKPLITTPTPTAQPPPAGTNTPLPIDESPTPSRSRTGVDQLDEIIAIITSRDVEALRSKITFTTTSCITQDGLGGPPKCEADEEAGTQVEVLPFLGPEGNFTRKGEINNWNGLEASGLFAVYRVSDSAFSDENDPAGVYALVFVDPDKATSATLQVRDGGIVRIDHGFTFPPDIPPGAVAEYILPPLDETP